MSACEECRRAEATVALTWQSRCETREKRLCDACARAVDLPFPFALAPLPDRGKQPLP